MALSKVVNIHFSTASAAGQKTSTIAAPTRGTALPQALTANKPEVCRAKGMQTTNKNYISRYCGSAAGALGDVL